MPISDKEWFVVYNKLVPNPKYLGTYNNTDFVWTDSRPYPSIEEITIAIAKYDAKKAKQKNNKEAKAIYLSTLEAGLEIEITDWNSVTSTKKFYCNERGVIDLCLVLALNELDEEEPVYCMTMDGIVAMSYNEVKRISIIIGRHLYQVRQTYWASLQ